MQRLVVAFRDTRTRERAERSQADLVSTVAHELRSPLTSVKGFTATLLAKWDRFNDEQKKSCSRRSTPTPTASTRLLTELLDVSRIDAGRLEMRKQVVDLPQSSAASSPAGSRPATRRTASLCCRGRSAGDVARPRQDRPGHRQPGRERVAARRRAPSRSRPSASRLRRRSGRGDRGRRGRGHRRDSRPRVFTRFWRGGQAGGTGLGLYIVKGLVEAHHGEHGVDVAPAAGGGAQFRFVLPAGGVPVLVDATASGGVRMAETPSGVTDRPARCAGSRPILPWSWLVRDASTDPPRSRAPLTRSSEPRRSRPWRAEEIPPRAGGEALAAVRSAERPATDLDALPGPSRRTSATGRRCALARREHRRAARPGAGRRGQAGQRRAGRRPGGVRRAGGRAEGRARRPGARRGGRRRHAARDRRPRGARHPLTTMDERIADVFVAMGWEVAEGPEVEPEWFNFDALNFGRTTRPGRCRTRSSSTPATPACVLRTHTSPVQIRSLLDAHAADLRRRARAGPTAPTRSTPRTRRSSTRSRASRSTRASRWPTCAGTLDHFAAAMFGAGLRTRLRPSYFPFTEPSRRGRPAVLRAAAARRSATRPGRAGSAQSEGWIEWGGCGMVNPRVLGACGVDPERYSGFAFGMGIERTLMFRHGITDIRDIFEGDLRFTLPFGTEA